MTSTIQLCQESLKKTYKNINENDTTRTLPIPDKWRQALEKMICIFEKRLANNMKLMLLCDYFGTVKQQKDTSFNKVFKT